MNVFVIFKKFLTPLNRKTKMHIGYCFVTVCIDTVPLVGFVKAFGFNDGKRPSFPLG
jgi:hypothetical protein